MGKLLRKVWIGLLSGTAALAACNFSSEQPCYYGPPEVPNGDTIENTNPKERREMLRQRIESIRSIVEERQHSEIYGPPEMIEKYERETQRLQAEADSLERELKAMDK